MILCRLCVGYNTQVTGIFEKYMQKRYYQQPLFESYFDEFSEDEFEEHIEKSEEPVQ